MAGRKTGALLAVSCALGALAGGADESTSELMRAFGHHLGMAFQLVDDILGIWGDPRRTGKPAHSDLTNHKKSLPVVAALRAGSKELSVFSALTVVLFGYVSFQFVSFVVYAFFYGRLRVRRR